MTVLIILGVVIIYLIIGYIYGIRLKKAHLYSFGWGNQILFFIDGDSWHFLGIFPCPWGFTKPLFNMSYRIVIDATTGKIADEIAKLPNKNSCGQSITYSQPIQLTGVDEMHRWVVTATERTNNTRKRSIQGALIDINFPIAGLVFKGLLGAVVMIDDAKKMLNIEGGLAQYVQNETTDAVSAYFTENEPKWEREWNKTGKELSFGVFLIQKMEKFRIDDRRNKMKIPGTRTDWKTYLNEEKFKQFGVSYKEPSWTLGYGQDALNLIKERRQQQLNAEKEKTFATEEKMMTKKRVIWVNNSVAQSTVLQNTAGKLAELAKIFYAAKGEQYAKISGLKVLMPGKEDDALSQQFVNTLTALQVNQEVNDEN